MQKITIEFICNDNVFEESSEQNEFDDILLKPLRDAGYKLLLMSSAIDKGSPYYLYEIFKNAPHK